MGKQIQQYNSKLLSATDKEDRDFWGKKVDKARESLNVINASPRRQQPPQAGKYWLPMMINDVLRKNELIVELYFLRRSFLINEIEETEHLVDSSRKVLAKLEYV